MARDFGVAPEHLSIGVSAYLVALTVFIPASGWAAERFGERRIFAGAIIVFTVASLLCALAGSLWSFTAARTLQGLGGAMMVPVGRLVVLRDTPKAGIVKAIAILTWPALTAPVLGPVLGGWISTHWSWHWIFLLNLPLGLLALVLSLKLVRNGEPSSKPFDLRGFVLSGLGFALFMGGIEIASRRDLPAWLWPSVLAAGIALLWACARYVQRTPHALFNLGPLHVRTFRVTAIGGSLFRTAIFSAPFLLPLMFQVGFGYSAIESGALLLWLFAGNVAMKLATTAIMQRFGFRKVLVGNGLLVAGGFACCALLGADTPRLLVIVLLFFIGMTRSMQFTAFNTIGFADVTPAQMRDATMLFSVLQQMNAGMGIAIGALALSVSQVLLGDAAGLAHTSDFRLALLMMAGMALLAIIDVARLPANAGQDVLARRPA
jgi:EmrB/QacA subfamily drug resistance transporter